MLRQRKALAWALAPLFALNALGGCSAGKSSNANAEDGPRPLAVRVANAERARRAEPIYATGFVLDESERTLSFAVEGVVAQITVDEGDRFRKGQLLARLDLTPVAARMEQANAAVSRAERNLARADQLASTASIARQTQEDANTAAEVARADLRLARFARQHAVIVAEGDGIVLGRNVDARETVGAGTPILVVSLAKEGRVVRVSLTDRELVRVAVGDAVRLTIDAYPGRELEGRVRRISAAPDRSNGLFPVEIEAEGLADPSLRLVAGLVARAVIAPADVVDVTLVPARAIVEAEGDRGYVWVLGEDQRSATRRDIRIAFFDGDRIAISSGLDGVARVITEGASFVRTGAPLRVEEAGSASPVEGAEAAR